jgi:hypothetical protein
MTHCANCGSKEIEVGEGGAPSKCATCGGKSFATVTHNTDDLVALRYDGKRPEIRVITHKSMNPEKAKTLFAAIHKAIDG